MDETLKEFLQVTGQSTIPVSQELSLEDTLEAFRQTVNQSFHEITDATMENTETITRLEGQLDHLVVEFNIVEEEELQSQDMARGQYMIVEDGSNNSYHEHVQASTFRNEEVVKETVNEPHLEDPLEAYLAQSGDDLDLDKLFEQADAILDPTLKVRIEIGETTEISFPNSSSVATEPFIVDNHEEEEKEEQVEHIEPPTTPNLSYNKEMSIKAHSFITIPLETFLEPQASLIQCLKEPFYAKTLKDLCKEVGKPRNRHPKKILLSDKVGYLRWRNILPKGYQILKKKGWKGLVGHPSDRGKCGIFYFLFSALYF